MFEPLDDCCDLLAHLWTLFAADPEADAWRCRDADPFLRSVVTVLDDARDLLGGGGALDRRDRVAEADFLVDDDDGLRHFVSSDALTE